MKDGGVDGEKPQHITTPQALMETCRLLGGRKHAWPWVAMGTGVHGELNGHRRLCLCPGLNALGSIC